MSEKCGAEKVLPDLILGWAEKSKRKGEEKFRGKSEKEVWGKLEKGLKKGGGNVVDIIRQIW